MTIITTPAKKLDYNGLSSREDRAFVRKREDIAIAELKRTALGIWNVGKAISEVKSVLKHGDFKDWIQGNLGLSYHTAHNFQKVFESFPDLPQKLKNSTFEIALTVLYRLSQADVTQEAREVAVELIESGDIKNLADAKEFIEVSKPPKPTPPAPLPMPPVNDDPFEDDTEPTHDEDEFAAGQSDPGTGYFDKAPDPPSQSLPVATPDTLSAVQAQREQQAQDETESTEGLDDARWLVSLPTYRWLQTTGNRGLFFKRAALDYRQSEKALIAFQKAISAGNSIKMADGSPFSRVVSPLLSLKHPRFWRVCGGCKGAGCARCATTGYDLAAGLDPLVLLEEMEAAK